MHFVLLVFSRDDDGRHSYDLHYISFFWSGVLTLCWLFKITHTNLHHVQEVVSQRVNQFLMSFFIDDLLSCLNKNPCICLFLATELSFNSMGLFIRSWFLWSSIISFAQKIHNYILRGSVWTFKLNEEQPNSIPWGPNTFWSLSTCQNEFDPHWTYVEYFVFELFAYLHECNEILRNIEGLVCKINNQFHTVSHDEWYTNRTWWTLDILECKGPSGKLGGHFFVHANIGRWRIFDVQSQTSTRLSNDLRCSTTLKTQ